jgi:LL-diaminopimelate aminotransferase
VTHPQGAQRLAALPPYPLAEIPAIRARLLAEGVDIIDLGAGDADLAPPPRAVERMTQALADPDMSRYPFQRGYPPFRRAVADWMAGRFGVELDPMGELLPLLGSKEGIAHLPLGVVDPGDVVVVPDPGYQAYRGGAVFAGAEPVAMPLRPENDFLLKPWELDASIRDRIRMVVLNYPNNPTSATAPASYLEEVVAFCRERGAVLVHDHAYSEIAFDGYRPPSILELDGAREVAIEFHSCSKTYNMTGWRLGWAAGSTELVGALTRVKTFVDTGVFKAVQAGGLGALESYDDWFPTNLGVFQARRDTAVAALQDAGFDARPPRATMYLWVPLPKGLSGTEFARRALEEAGVVVMPGTALGAGGEGFFRVALTVPEARLVEAAGRLSRLA